MGLKRILGRRRAEDDTVRIEDETTNEWWADRPELDVPIDRRWRRSVPRFPFRRSTDVRGPVDPDDPTPPSSPFFAPPADTDPLPGPWSGPIDPGARPTDDLFAPADRILQPRPAPRTYRSPWDVLGLTSDATWETVVARHRELAKAHHPDRAGADAAARDAAADTMADINAAFDDLGRIYRLTDER